MAHHEANDVDDFLKHRSSDRGSAFLGNWKKNKKVNLFLHTRQMPIAVWRHGVPKYVVKDDEGGDSVTHVWGDNLNCPEDESVLRRQYKYTDAGARVAPPKRCPICRLHEAVRALIDEGKLKWTQPVFRFHGDYPKEEVIMHAGGLIGEFGGDLDDAEKALMRKAGIFQSEAWKENTRAKMSYIFFVVDAENVDKGVQVAIETALVGDKVKDVINSERESKDKDKGDPYKHPYCIQWEYKEEEKEFGKKYAARRIDRIPLTPEIEALIRGPKPEYAKLVAPMDFDDVRARLEKACYPDARKLIPWDAIFAFVKEEEPDHPDMKGINHTPLATVQWYDPDEEVQCDCGAVMKAADPKCEACGKVYEVEVATPLPPPPPPQRQVRSRSSVKREAAQQEKASAKPAESFTEPTPEEDPIPF